MGEPGLEYLFAYLLAVNVKPVYSESRGHPFRADNLFCIDRIAYEPACTVCRPFVSSDNLAGNHGSVRSGYPLGLLPESPVKGGDEFAVFLIHPVADTSSQGCRNQSGACK